MNESDNIRGQMNALNKTLICNPQIEWSKLLSGTSPLSLSASPPVWMCAFDREKMPEVGRKKSTQSQLPGFELALLRQQLASRAWNFTTQLRKQNTRYYVTITRFQKQIKVKKVKLILQLSFAKKIKAERIVTFNGRLSWYRIDVAAMQPD